MKFAPAWTDQSPAAKQKYGQWKRPPGTVVWELYPVSDMLWENVWHHDGSNRPIRPEISQSKNKKHSHLHYRNGLIIVVGERRCQARQDQNCDSLDPEAAKQKRSTSKAIHGQGVHQHDEQLHHRLDAVDDQCPRARIPSETLVYQCSIYGDGGDSSTLLRTSD